METDFESLVPFTDQSESFTNGFECGQFWDRMNKKELIKKQLYHITNKEQIRLFGIHFGYLIIFDDIDDTWGEFTITKMMLLK